jgi:DNA-binding response OmpR family regulator
MEMSADSKVLIVDDDHALADLIVMLLQLDGFQAEAAYAGQQALDAVERDKPAAIVLDVMMPDVDGFAVLRHVRSDDRLADVAVLMLSARVDEETREQCLAAGADAYITKPAEPQHLTSELRTQLAKRQSG